MFEAHTSKHSLFRLKITVGCLVCACGVCGVGCVLHVVLCVVLVVCVLLCYGGACVVCGEAWRTLSLALSPSSPLSLSFSLSSLCFSLLYLFLFLSLFLLSLLFSPPNTMERTDQPTRRPTSRHLNVIWCRASAQQSVPSLLLSPPSSLFPLLKKKEGLFITGIFPARNLFFITVLI